MKIIGATMKFGAYSKYKWLIKALLFLLISFNLINCRHESDKDWVQDYVVFEYKTIYPDGGTYQFSEELTLVIPEGAVTEPIQVKVRRMKATEVLSVLSNFALVETDIIAAVDLKPDGLAFNKPISIRISGLDVDPGTIPITHIVDVTANTYKMVESVSTLDPAAGTLELEISHFSAYAINETANWVKNKGCQEQEDEDKRCKCGAIKVISKELHAVCGAGEICQLDESTVAVTFLDCGGLVEESTLREISESCDAEMQLSVSPSRIQPQETATVQAEVKAACIPLEDHTITFVHDNLGTTSPSSSETNNAGVAVTTFTAGDKEGISALSANATVKLYTFYAYANGEEFYGPAFFRYPSDTTAITIKEKTNWTGKFSAFFSGCTSFICIDNYTVDINFGIEILDEPIVDPDLDFLIGWTGQANIIQSGSVYSNLEGAEVANIQMSGFADEIFGSYNISSKIISFESLMLIMLDHFQGDLCIEQGCPLIFDGWGFAETIDEKGKGAYPIFDVVLGVEEVSKIGQAYFIVDGEPAYIKGQYDLILRDNNAN